MSKISSALSSLLIARLNGSRRFGGLRVSGLSPGSPFTFVLEYLSRFLDWLDGQRHAAVPNVLSFCGRSGPSGVNMETPASAWWKRCRGLSARDADMNAMQHVAFPFYT